MPKQMVDRVEAELARAQRAAIGQPARPNLEPLGLKRVVELTTGQLELDAAFIAQLTDAGHVYAAVAGDANAFGLSVGDAIPTVNADGVGELMGPELRTAFCRRLISGESRASSQTRPGTNGWPISARCTAPGSERSSVYRCGLPRVRPSERCAGSAERRVPTWTSAMRGSCRCSAR